MSEGTVGPWWIITSKSAFDYLYVIAELQKFTRNNIYTSPTTFFTLLTSTFSIYSIKKKPPNIFKEWVIVFSNVNYLYPGVITCMRTFYSFFFFFNICHYWNCEVSRRNYGLLMITYNITELLYGNIQITWIYGQVAWTCCITHIICTNYICMLASVTHLSPTHVSCSISVMTSAISNFNLWEESARHVTVG